MSYKWQSLNNIVYRFDFEEYIKSSKLDKAVIKGYVIFNKLITLKFYETSKNYIISNHDFLSFAQN